MGTTFYRILSGSAAGWANIVLSFGQRLLIIPVILSFWDINKYGLYLLMSAWISLLSVPSRSFEGVVVFECLKLGNENQNGLSMLISSTILINIFTTFALIAALTLMLVFNIIPVSFLEGGSILDWIMVTTGALLVRCLVSYPLAIINAGLYCFGYQPKLAWLNVIQTLILMVVPAIGVVIGFGVRNVILSETGSLFIVTLYFLLGPIKKMAIKTNIWHWNINLKYGYNVWVFSLQNFAKDMCDMFRQQGIRALLGPLIGISELTRFATLRTAANVATQSISSLNGPLMPELMRFLKDRNQSRTEASFAVIWLPLITILCPCVLIIQASIEPFFYYWTRGKIQFDPYIFAILSIGILIYAASLPAVAVVQGNNLLKNQLILSVITSCIVLACILITSKNWGIMGVTISLVIGDIVSSILYYFFAKTWLFENSLSWPNRFNKPIIYALIITSFVILTTAFIQNSGKTTNKQLTVIWIIIIAGNIALFKVIKNIMLLMPHDSFILLKNFERLPIIGKLISKIFPEKLPLTNEK